MQREKLKLGMVALCGAVMLAGMAQAAPILEDSFESLTPPASPTTDNWASNSNPTVRDSSTFGVETTFVSISGSLFSKNLTSLPDVTILSFRFVDETADTAGASEALQVGWATSSGDLNSSGQVVKFLLNQGTIKGATSNTLTPSSIAYSMNTPHLLQLIYNASDTTTVTDYNGSTDLEPNTAYLYLDGGLVGSITTSATQAGRTPGRFGFRLFSGNDNVSIKIDDVVLTTVPEPASLTLLGAAGLLLRRRRR